MLPFKSLLLNQQLFQSYCSQVLQEKDAYCIVQENLWGMDARRDFTASYIVDFRVYVAAYEKSRRSIEHTDISQISWSSSVPTCRVRVSENLEGTLDGVPHSVWRWLMYCQLSYGSRIKHFLDSILLKIPDPQGSRDKHCRSHYETYNAIVFLPRAAAKSRSGQLTLARVMTSRRLANPSWSDLNG